MVGVIEFYKGQNVFITGASGFMGKALIEKLLRSCPDIGKIYVLLRPKRGKDILERLGNILDNPLFDKVKHDKPENLKKIIPVKGDCSELGLGLSLDDRRLLVEEVTVVFHGAANVKFSDPLKDAVLLNTRGAREVMLLARSINNLKVLVHISTTYCNCDRSEIDEVIYPSHADWRKVIHMAETMDNALLEVLTKKIIGVHPNTYTFTKSLAEHVIKDHGDNMPIVVFRPSIVISTLEEPISGWLDNYNGPVGMFLAGGKGLLRTVYADPNITSDFMPVDVCIKFMLVASWLKAISGDKSRLAVYNSSSYNLKSITVGKLIKMSLECVEKLPLNDSMWYPRNSVRNNALVYNIEAILLHMLPGMIIDGILKLSGRKSIICRIHQKIYTANMALQFFMRRSWVFNNDNLLSLRSHILPCDKGEFKLDHLEQVNLEDYFTNCINGGRLFLLKEYPDTLPKAKVHFKRMYWLDKFVRIITVSSLMWYILQNAHLQNIYQDMLVGGN